MRRRRSLVRTVNEINICMFIRGRLLPLDHHPHIASTESHLTLSVSYLLSISMKEIVLRKSSSEAPPPSAGTSSSDSGPVLPEGDALRCCASCRKPEAAGLKLKKCSSCRNILYCSAACQKANWPKHKYEDFARATSLQCSSAVFCMQVCMSSGPSGR